MEAQYINVSELMRKWKSNWRTILMIAGITGLVGLILIITTPRRYQSVVQLAPEQINEDNSPREAIYPEIYPNIVGATNFIRDLFPLTVCRADGSLTTDYRTYIVRYQKKSLTDYPKSWIAGLMLKMRGAEVMPEADGYHGPTRLSREDEEVIRGIRGAIQCIWDKKTDVITISVVDQDPLIAATVADSVTARLQAAITDYRTAKARIDLEFAQRNCDEAYNDYEQANNHYTQYAETYQYASSEKHKLQTESLRHAMEMRMRLYNTAHEQLQEAKARLQEQTPAFTIIQEPMVAGKPFGMSRLMQLILWLMLGCIIGCGYVWKRK